ncbi:hypothetical protein KOI35_45480 [Actinoplanes bogorensis]|uniref:Uncharacterized protein n=1 Tax=Paractinoplanes bogorensis TaxID=1610840 RepID=A0ABS5Z502_9ACTN|nr:hypothetical protein [Actinoplanes bogorensis]MBU2670777.1 hypothetical protein [Actinoplanes bogorensis]
MTGNAYDQMLRDADPQRTAVPVPPDEVLLAQILAEPQGRHVPYRLAVIGVAAAVLVAAVGVVVAVNRTSGLAEIPAAPSPSVASPSAAPSASALPAAAGSLLEPDQVRRAAKEGPRIVPAAGWKLIHVVLSGDRLGEMAWKKDGQVVDSSWYSTARYKFQRPAQKDAVKVRVGSLTGWMISEGSGRYVVTTEPRAGDGVWATIDSGSGFGKAEFLSFLAKARTVGVDAWIKLVASGLTVEGAADDRTYRIFIEGGLPQPPNWDHPAIARIATSDVRAFDTALTKVVACGWLTEWQRATAKGDPRFITPARDALLGSGSWPVLVNLEKQGSGLRKEITGMAEHVVNGGASEAEVEAYKKTLC